MTFYFYGCNYKEGKITVLKLENSPRICPFCLEDLAGAVPSATALRLSGGGGGQRLTGPSELRQ